MSSSSTCSVLQLVTQERRLSTTASRTMAAMSLGFIVLVTPWTIQEVVAACTGTRAPAALDFLATWLALSNSFWNPFLYWLLNNNFRRISRELLFSRVSGARSSSLEVNAVVSIWTFFPVSLDKSTSRRRRERGGSFFEKILSAKSPLKYYEWFMTRCRRARPKMILYDVNAWCVVGTPAKRGGDCRPLERKNKMRRVGLKLRRKLHFVCPED